MKAPKGTITRRPDFQIFEKQCIFGAKTGGSLTIGYGGAIPGSSEAAHKREEERGAKGKVCASLREVASIIVVPISASAGVSIVGQALIGIPWF
jgi:hypothetical protein